MNRKKNLAGALTQGISGVTRESILEILSYAPEKASYLHKSSALLDGLMGNLYKNLTDTVGLGDFKKSLPKLKTNNMSKYLLAPQLPVFLPYEAEKRGAIFQYYFAKNMLVEFPTLEAALEFAGCQGNAQLEILQTTKRNYKELDQAVKVDGILKKSFIDYVPVCMAEKYYDVDLKAIREALSCKLMKIAKAPIKQKGKKVKLVYDIMYTPYQNLGIEHDIFRAYYNTSFVKFMENIPEALLLGYASEYDVQLFYEYLRALTYVYVFVKVDGEKCFVGPSPWSFTDYINVVAPFWGNTYNFLMYGDLYDVILAKDDEDGSGGVPEVTPELVPVL